MSDASFHLQFLSCCPVGPNSPPEHGFVAQLVEHRTRRYALVQVQPKPPEAGSHPDNVRPSVEAYMEMKMVAENCTVGGNRLSVMVLRM